LQKTTSAEVTMATLGEGFAVKEIVGCDGVLRSKASSLAYFELQPEHAFAAHFHRYSHEIYLCVSGRAQLVVNGDPIDLTAGDVVLLEPNDDHTGRAVGGEPFVYWAITTPAYHIDDHIAS